MSELLTRDVVEAIDGQLLSGDPGRVLHGISTDTRALVPGQLFLALSGPNFDGNAFAPAALAAGAGGLLLRGARLEDLGAELRAALAAAPEAVVVLHPDPHAALAQLAAWYRRSLGVQVIGITGSCGKTTTKDYLLQLLGRVRRVTGSPRSFNNDVGVPLTLLAAEGATESLVAEIGTSGPGEIERLCRIATPDVGVVTNVGASHLEGLGSLEGVAVEKSALARSLPADGFLVLNADCRFHELFRGVTSARVVTFSIEGSGDMNATDLVFDGGRSIFQLDGHEVCLPALGTHNVQNLLAALAVCVGLGHSLEEVLPAVAEIEGQSGRLETFELAGLRLVDDSYNANPTSARAAVRVLAGMHGHSRRVLVLGDMLELGEFGAELHHEVGRAAAEAGIDRLVLVGDLCRAAAAGALEAGMAPSEVHHFATRDEAEAALEQLVAAGDVVLVKGSRGMALERLVASLRTRFAVAPQGSAGSTGGGGERAMACYSGWEVR